MVRVSWFIPVDHRDYNRMPASVWIRCLQLIPYLEERGVPCIVNEPDAEADVAVIVRQQDEQAYQLAHQQKQKGRRVVFDLVVNYFDEAQVEHVGRPVTHMHIEECLRMLSVADVVTCASAYIAERAREFHSWVEYLPDSIDRRHFVHNKPITDFHRPRLRAIWSGISHKAAELEPILPLLQERKIELTVISNEPPDLKLPGWLWRRRLDYRFLPWQYETFPQHILNGELCVVHRPVDNPYNQGHSLFKIGVFMTQGIPAIVSPVPSYQEVLQNGSGGQVCSSIREWEQILEGVLTDRDVLVQWSQQAQRLMEPYWTERVADGYVSLFEQLCEAPV